MLPTKETNSSEESECDDLDPNTSMEVEAAIVVLFPTLIVFCNVLCDCGLAKVTRQAKEHCYVRASRGVPSQLQPTNVMQLDFDRKFYLQIFLRTHTCVSLKCLLVVFFFLAGLALCRKHPASLLET